MSISAKVILGSSEVQGQQEVPVVVEVYNSSTASAALDGLELVSKDGLVQVGTFPTFQPVVYQVVSGGVAINSPVPAWGTGEQSTETNNGDPLIYWVGNLSGAALQTITYEGNLDIPGGTPSTVSTNQEPNVGFLVYGFGTNGSKIILEQSFSGSVNRTGSISGSTPDSVFIKTADGKFGGSGSVSFDGTGRVSWVPAGGNINTTNLSGSPQSTLECYFYLDDNTAYQPLISQGSSSTVWSLQVSGTELKVSGSDTNFLNGGEITSSATTINTGEWYHIAAVKSGSTLSFYLDGTRLDEIALTTAYSGAADQLQINLGCDRQEATLFLSGSITNARISDIAQYSGSSFTTSSVPFTNPTLITPIIIASTSSFQSNVIPVNPPLLPTEQQFAVVGAEVSVQGAVTAVEATTETLTILSKPVERVSLSIVGSPIIANSVGFARPIAFSDFDASIQTNIVYKDGSQITLDPNLPIHDFTSSHPARVAVVQSGSFGVATGSVGNPQATAGAGALTFTFPNSSTPVFAVIENRLSPNVTGSITIGVVN
jgi:hypothetical protein